MADLAFCFHWPPHVLNGLTVDEILAWHAQIGRINREIERRHATPKGR